MLSSLVFANGLPGEYYPFIYEAHSTGVRHEGMAGVGYSLKSSVNALSLSPSQLGFIDKKKEKLSVEYGAMPLIMRGMPFLIFPQYIDAVLKNKRENSGWFGFQLKNISVTSSEEFSVVKWENESIIETGETYKDNHNLTLLTVGYGTIIHPKEKNIHSVGVALSFGWYRDANFGDPLNCFGFDFDLGYTLHFAKLFKLGITMQDIPIGKIIVAGRENFSGYKVGTVYSIGLDTKHKNDYHEKQLNFSLETYIKHYPTNFNSENKNETIYDFDEHKFYNLIWSVGYEVLIANKLTIRNGMIFYKRNSATTNYTFPFGLGFKINDQIEINSFIKRIRIIREGNAFPQFGLSVSAYGLGKKNK